MDVVYLDLGKVLVSYNILTDKLIEYGLNKWAVRWI